MTNTITRANTPTAGRILKMARISDRLIVQLVEDRLVVFNDTTRAEIEIYREEIAGFLAACEYLIGFIDPPIPPFVHPAVTTTEPELRAQLDGINRVRRAYAEHLGAQDTEPGLRAWSSETEPGLR